MPSAYLNGATYDPATTLGQARLFTGDTDTVNAIFGDSEFTVFLNLASGNPMLAAAFALDTIATDAARLAVLQKTQNTATDKTKLAAEIAARAETLRAQCGVAPAVGLARISACRTDCGPFDCGPFGTGHCEGWGDW